MNRAAWLGLVLGILAIVGIAYYFHSKEAAQTVETASAPLPPPASAPPPGIPETHYPVPAKTPAEHEHASPLPALDESDSAMLDSLESLFGKSAVESLLIPKQFIHRVVATVDSLDRSAPLPLRLWPLRHIESAPSVTGTGDSLAFGPANVERYQPYITVLRAVDAKQLAQVYLHFYPLFQEAYKQLGYPDQQFNDRLVAVIDSLLVTPSVNNPILLVQPKVLYQFADPDLEALSWGQKLLIRMGVQNQELVKSKLREFRAVIVAG